MIKLDSAANIDHVARVAHPDPLTPAERYRSCSRHECDGQRPAVGHVEWLGTPCKWMAIEGLCQYGDPLAGEIEHRWLRTVSDLFDRDSRLADKYVLVQPRNVTVGGHGAYPLQDDFGWINGVTRRLLGDNPLHQANRARAANGR